MNVILFDERDMIEGQRIRISGRRQDHMMAILKSSMDDELKVGMVNGKCGKGRIVDMGESGIILDVSLTENPPEKIPVTVVLALPRPPVFRRVVGALTAMGVGKMFFIQTARVEKSYWNSPALHEENIRLAMMLGLEQSGDTVVPQIVFARRFKPFVEDELPGIVEGKKGLIAHPVSATACPMGIFEDVVLAVGPEGGWTNDEVENFYGVGFELVDLGPRILRVETAVQALVGRIMPIEKR